MNSTNEFYDFEPKDAANRAVQAIYGLYSWVLTSANEEEKLNEFAKSIIETQAILLQQPDAQNLSVYRQFRQDFHNFISQKEFPIFDADHERIWQLFLERYSFPSQQLRINMSDMFECVDLKELALTLKKDGKYFYRLPLSSEIVISPTKGAMSAAIVIPPRLLVLDMLLMFFHCTNEHYLLENQAKSQIRNETLMLEVHYSGRLDSYARQILTIGTTICDNVLTEYGYLVESILESDDRIDEKNRINRIHKQGVTNRLRSIPIEWSRIFDTKLPNNSNFILQDMINLVQIRNRLIHPDGRVNCWHAFNLSPKTGIGWTFSDRVKLYTDRAKYGMHQSHIGNEFGLAKFCIETVVSTINLFHSLIFSGENIAPWLELNTLPNGHLDFRQIIEEESLFEIFRNKNWFLNYAA